MDDFVRRHFAQHELEPADQTGWDEIGFHRPLGGFLMFFVLALFIGQPLLLGYSMLAPRCKSASICSRVPPPNRARYTCKFSMIRCT